MRNDHPITIYLTMLSTATSYQGASLRLKSYACLLESKFYQTLWDLEICARDQAVTNSATILIFPFQGLSLGPRLLSFRKHDLAYECYIFPGRSLKMAASQTRPLFRESGLWTFVLTLFWFLPPACQRVEFTIKKKSMEPKSQAEFWKSQLFCFSWAPWPDLLISFSSLKVVF